MRNSDYSEKKISIPNNEIKNKYYRKIEKIMYIFFKINNMENKHLNLRALLLNTRNINNEREYNTLLLRYIKAAITLKKR